MADQSDASSNLFANDGSFMEMFKRLQEKQKSSQGPSSVQEEKQSEREVVQEQYSEYGRTEGSTSTYEINDSKRGDRTTISAPNPNEQEDVRKEREEREEEEEEKRAGLGKQKTSQGVMLGKRKSLMKSIELREKRKRRREELELEQRLAQQQDQDGKSSAWKAYMAQVKAYEAQNCSEQDGYKRPLVK